MTKLHRYLTENLFYALALCSLLAIAILYVRISLAERLNYIFLAWNLFLAWIPYFFSLAAGFLWKRSARLPWLWMLPAALWLLFFPNAPYIATDLIHLQFEPPLAWWYDAGLVLIFAFTGCFLGVVSLRVMHRMVEEAWGRVSGWAFALAMMLLGGLGIYLGRVARWNSWDLFRHPKRVVYDGLMPLSDPAANRTAIGMTLMFASVFFVCYIFYLAARNSESRA